MPHFRSWSSRLGSPLPALALVLISLAPVSHAADQHDTVGKPAPACRLVAHEGFAAIDLAAYRGQVVYLDFWASWCFACLRSFPFMNDLVDRYGARGFTVIAITLDEELDEARAFLAEHPANVVIAADPEASCARAFGLQAMPSSYLIDASHTVREAHLGFHPGRTRDMRSAIEALLPTPAPAP